MDKDFDVDKTQQTGDELSEGYVDSKQFVQLPSSFMIRSESGTATPMQICGSATRNNSDSTNNGSGSVELTETNRPPTPPPSPENLDLDLLLCPNIQPLPWVLVDRANALDKKADDYLKTCLKHQKFLQIKRAAILLQSKIASMESWIDRKKSILASLSCQLTPRAQGTLPVIAEEPANGESVTCGSFKFLSEPKLQMQTYKFTLFDKHLHSQANYQLSEIAELERQLVEGLLQLKNTQDYDELLAFVDQRLGSTSPEQENMDESDLAWESERQSVEASEFMDREVTQFSSVELIRREWNMILGVSNSRKTRFEIASSLNVFYETVVKTNEWIVNKFKVLLSTDELGTDLNSLIHLQRKLLGWESDLQLLDEQVQSLRTNSNELINALQDEAPGRRDLRLTSDEWLTAVQVGELTTEVEQNWTRLQMALADRQEKLLVSAELQQFLQSLDDNQLWLLRMQGLVATTDQPRTLTEAKNLLDEHAKWKTELESKREEFAQLIEYGRCITSGETDTHYAELDQRLDRLESGWTELVQIWLHCQKMLEENVIEQSFLQEVGHLEKILENQASQLVDCELLVSVGGVPYATV
ncbi:spectrin beta [Paragonimus westermani]|uniref:Spectrin beta n=1 Tax=Paragonimus westermani TaxID=34504 RepID=A0A5J4NYS9_9TREM|nr:spectrin beta [Paragonimus westermani]